MKEKIKGSKTAALEVGQGKITGQQKAHRVEAVTGVEAVKVAVGRGEQSRHAEKRKTLGQGPSFLSVPELSVPFLIYEQPSFHCDNLGGAREARLDSP